MRILALALAVILSIPTFGQEKRWAVVELSTVYMRQQPDYESALETQELMGTIVEIVGEKGYWREIVSPQPYKAWATEKGLTELSVADIQEYKNAPKVQFIDLYGHLYCKPSVKSETICDLVGGDVLRFSQKKGAWSEVLLPSGKRGWVLSKSIKNHNGYISIAKGEGNSESISDDTMENIIADAQKLLGVPYLWGGMSAKGVDCSGLVRISYLMNDILLPRNASQQIFCGDSVPMEIDIKFWEEEERKSPEFTTEMQTRIRNLKRGDLVFFGTPAEGEKKQKVTHVGIYLGNNHIIHSSHMVRINSLIPTDEDYYENSHRLLGAIRL